MSKFVLRVELDQLQSKYLVLPTDFILSPLPRQIGLTMARQPPSSSWHEFPLDQEFRSSHLNAAQVTCIDFDLKTGAEVSSGTLHLVKRFNDRQEGFVKEQGCLVYRKNYDSAVLVLGVPSYLSFADFAEFVGKKYSVSHFRFLEDKNKSLALLKMPDSRAAEAFVAEFSGKAFGIKEICHAFLLSSIEFKTQVTSEIPALFILDSQSYSDQEVPMCPVCLERLDAGTSGIVTVQCSHSFHCSCLVSWQDASCPVCRYTHRGDNQCFICLSRDNLWICLLCGNIGCDRYSKGHAFEHYKETGHLYALEIESQRVWDYAGDNYVHRLLGNTEGKIVVADKAAFEEIDQLLVAQLESQRLFYEDMIDKMRKKFDFEIKSLKKEADAILSDKNDKAKELEEKIMYIELENQKLHNQNKNLKDNFANLLASQKKLMNEFESDKQLNVDIISNVKSLREEKKASDLRVRDLEEQVADLLKHFDLTEKLSKIDEAKEGTIKVARKANKKQNG